MENTSLDFNIIAQKCLVGSDSNANIDTSEIVERLEGLKSDYTDIQIIVIYNHFLLTEHRPEVLKYLLRTLDKYRDSSSIDAIKRLFQMKEHIEPYDEVDYTEVRILCIKAISNFKDGSSVFMLLDALNDKNENYQIRLNCADALGRLGDRYAVVPLIDIVSDESEKSIYIRESAATALGMLGDIRAADSLVSILETKNGLADKFTYLKEKVIESLNKLTPNDDRAFKALKKALMDENPQVRIMAIEAIMNCEHRDSAELIKDMLKDTDEEVQKNAVIALYNLEGEKALLEIIENPDYSLHCKDEVQDILDSEVEDDDE